MHPTTRPTRERSCDSARRSRRTAGFSLVEVMLAAIVFTMAGLGSYWLLIKSYQLVAFARYRDEARAVLQTFAEQFQRLQTSNMVGSVTYTRWLFNPSGYTGYGLLWDNTATPGVSLNSISVETIDASSATPPTGLVLMIGGAQNGIRAIVTHEVAYVDPSNGATTASAPEQANEGELLVGTFKINFGTLGDDLTGRYVPGATVTDCTQTLSVLRAAP